jgi:hypothetical protein
VPAAKKDATSWLVVFDCIADQVAQGGAKKQAIAEYRGIAGNHVDAYAPAQRSLFVLAAGLPQDLLDAYRRKLGASRAFSDAQRSQDLLKLLLEPVDRVLTGSQISKFGARSDSNPEEFVSALNDLEWLPEIVPGYGEQHCLEIRDSVRSRGSRHAPTHRWCSGYVGSFAASRRPDLASHLAHVRSPAGQARRTWLQMQASRGFSPETS